MPKTIEGALAPEDSEVDSARPPEGGAPRRATGRVLAIHGAESLVEVEGELHRCRLSGRLKFERGNPSTAVRAERSWEKDVRESRGRWERSRDQAPPSSPIAVGDNVVVRIQPDGSGHVLERLERKSWLGRVRPTKGPQVIAANVEIALVVMAVALPEPDFYLLDQFVVQACAGGLEPWIVFNKIDLIQDEGADPGHESPSYPPADEYRSLGYNVFCTSALTGCGIEDVQEALHGRTAVLAGPSGAGKSHLLNHLIPLAEARLGEISEWSGRGQHTTTHVAMYPLPGQGYLVDAPGIRRLSLWQVDRNQIGSFFPEFIIPAEQCEYTRCAHLNETGCAVRAAAEQGEISYRRYRHYREMREG